MSSHLCVIYHSSIPKLPIIRILSRKTHSSKFANFAPSFDPSSLIQSFIQFIQSTQISYTYDYSIPKSIKNLKRKQPAPPFQSNSKNEILESPPPSTNNNTKNSHNTSTLSKQSSSFPPTKPPFSSDFMNIETSSSKSSPSFSSSSSSPSSQPLIDQKQLQLKLYQCYERLRIQNLSSSTQNLRTVLSEVFGDKISDYKNYTTTQLPFQEFEIRCQREFQLQRYCQKLDANMSTLGRRRHFHLDDGDDTDQDQH